jgi:general nucleoside transport system permease protein
MSEAVNDATGQPSPADQPPSDGQPARRPWWQRAFFAVIYGNAFTVTLLAILSAMIIGGLLTAFTNTTVLDAWNDFFSSPWHAINLAWDTAIGVYIELFEGSIFNPHTITQLFQQASLSTAFHDGYVSAVFTPLSNTCLQATPLLLTGLAVALPYQAGMFNIGGESQWIGGAIVATYLGYGVSMPPGIHVIVCVIGGFIGGAATGAAVGLLKATTGAHEVIVTIMLNYIMADFLAYLLSFHYLMQAPGVNPVSPNIDKNAQLPHLFGPSLYVNVGFLIALAGAGAVWWLLTRTTTGFEFRAIGKNPNAARVAGINVERNWVLVMLFAGGLAGLAAAAVIQGNDFQLTGTAYGTYGIDAITVALLGRGKPIGVVWAALLFGALYAGAPGMESVTGTPGSIVEVLQALIVMFVAAPPLIRAIYRLRTTRAAGVSQVLSKGWNA